MQNKKLHTGVMRAGDIYKSMYILPKSEAGIRIFGLLLIPETEHTIQKMAENGNGNLNFIIPDAAKLYNYKLDHKNRKIKGGCIHCMEEYEEGIRAILPDVKIITHSLNEVTSTVLEAVRAGH